MAARLASSLSTFRRFDPARQVSLGTICPWNHCPLEPFGIVGAIDAIGAIGSSLVITCCVCSRHSAASTPPPRSPLEPFPLGTISPWNHFPLEPFPLGTISPWNHFPLEPFSLADPACQVLHRSPKTLQSADYKLYNLRIINAG
jgi:hypothetical protein